MPGAAFAMAEARHVRRGLAKVRALIAEQQSDTASWSEVERAESQGGSAPTAIDRAADRVLCDHLRAAELGLEVIVSGEEAGRDDPVVGRSPAIFFNVDPIDGTSNLRRLTQLFSVNVVTYIVVDSDSGPRLSTFAAHLWDPPLDRHYWWSVPTGSRFGAIDSSVTEDVLDVGGARTQDRLTVEAAPLAVASVSAQKQNRNRRFQNLLTQSYGTQTYTVGGAPLLRNLIDGRLDALVELDFTTSYDSAHLLIAHPRVTIGSPDGMVYRPADLAQVFASLERPKDRIVPPYIAAADYKTYLRLVDWYVAAERDGLL